MDRPSNTDRSRVSQERSTAMTPLPDIEAAAAYLNISPRSVADHIRA